MSINKIKKLSMKKLVVLAGAAGASVLLSFPVLAQGTSGNGGSGTGTGGYTGGSGAGTGQYNIFILSSKILIAF